MHKLTLPATAFALLVTVGVTAAAMAAPSTQPDDMLALDGEWLYVEDRTEGRADEDKGPPMSPRLRLRVDEDALVWLRSQGREDRMARDGKTVEVPEGDTITRITGTWKDGLLSHDKETVNASDGARVRFFRRAFEVVPEGMLVHVAIEPGDYKVVALYRHPEDIALPRPAQAVITDIGWLAGAWVGKNGKSTTEERWSPPAGGSLLGVSRTVRDGKLRAFEYLRIVERGGGLIYVAQPGGRPPTEFVLTDLDSTYAVFENPRHDSPQRIVYELLDDDVMAASIGFMNGGSPTRFEFTREVE